MFHAAQPLQLLQCVYCDLNNTIIMTEKKWGKGAVFKCLQLFEIRT